MSKKYTLLTAGMLGALAVAMGAFGAHALKSILIENGRLETYELAVRYHFFHIPPLLVLGLIPSHQNTLLKLSAWGFLGGILIFSGSLYALALSGQTFLGMITPLGGIFLMVGWVAFGWGAHQTIKQ